MSPLLRLVAWSAAVAPSLLATGCSRCSSKSTGSDAGVFAAEQHEISLPTSPSAPAFVVLPSANEFGVPRGCVFASPVRRSSLAAARVRFLASRRELSALALATSSDDAGTQVRRAGAVDLASGSVEGLPWAELESPPLFERAAGRWMSAWALPGAPGHTQVLFWQGGSRADTILEGDQLFVADLSCAAAECAVLTSLARSAEAPGATLLVGRVAASRPSFSRVDIEPGTDGWRPFAIAEPDDESKRFVVLTSPKQTALYRVSDGKAEKQAVLDTPHGSYDAVAAPAPVVVAPGLPIDNPCPGRDFPVLVLGADGKRHELSTPAAPESLLARPLAKGALLAWVAPVSCASRNRRVVYLTLLDARGAPASSPMAVADATGFALATRGTRVSLWLRQGDAMSWLDLTCTADAAGDAGSEG